MVNRPKARRMWQKLVHEVYDSITPAIKIVLLVFPSMHKDATSLRKDEYRVGRILQGCQRLEMLYIGCGLEQKLVLERLSSEAL
ncbi:hypothetical protein EVAR_85675_1 [Eumeta japonica]|uniref:Uncharacterized protein n=1 Tax=Eumeta variegata TaxID=151549 RepID=A0A4C1WC59_EUMVA|nr:hypothetical protein EVAR_85675_1 [Eumeta japonica]